jgi:hypothetical protein
MAKSKIRPKRSLASRKRGKELGADANFTKGLPEPLRPEVEGCMSRKLRDLLRRSGGSLNPSIAAEKRKAREERRAAEEEAQAQLAQQRPSGSVAAKRSPGPVEREPAAHDRAPDAKRQRKANGRDVGDAGHADKPQAEGASTGESARALPASKSAGPVARVAAKHNPIAKSARPAAAFKTGGKAKFGETNSAPPDLQFSQRLLKKAQAHGATPPVTRPSAAELERIRSLAAEKERVVANYKAARSANPSAFQKVPEFQCRVE